MKDFDNKWVYITGGSSGIGLACARLLLEKGANVIVFARKLAGLRTADEALQAVVKPKRRLITRQLDVTIDDWVRQAFGECISEYGAPDLLINSAGRSYTRKFEDIGYEIFDATLKVNLYGVRNCCAAAVPTMRAKGGGAIVNISSMAGFIGLYGFTNYCAAKFGVVGFSEALRNELRPDGLDVRVLCPPDTDTPGLKLENEHKPAATKLISEQARLISAETVARALIRGLKGREFMIIPGSDGRMVWRIKRLAPGLVMRILDRVVSRALKSVDVAR